MNLGELREELMDLVARTDYPVAKANLHLNRATRRIQRVASLPNMEKIINFTVDDSFTMPIPEDYLSTKHFLADTQAFEKVDMERFVKLPFEPIIGEKTKRYYSRLRDVWLLKPVAEGEILTIVYHSTWDTLVDDTDENTITVQGPDAVIYCAASYAGTYFMDVRTTEWEKRYQLLAEDLQEQQRQQEMSTSSAQSVDSFAAHDGYAGGW